MDKAKRHIDFLLFEDVSMLEIAGPSQVFSSAIALGWDQYNLNFVSLDGTDVTSTCGLSLRAAKPSPSRNHDLLIPGGFGVEVALKDGAIPHYISDFRQKTPKGRLISVCSGALLSAASGALDNIAATTHWKRQEEAQRNFPKVDWQTDRLFCIDGLQYSSAGVTTGIDLALEIVRRDCGGEAALAVARHLVVHLKRDGGQSQFSDLLETQFLEDNVLSGLIAAIFANPGRRWTLDEMSKVAHLTPRTLTRRFDKLFATSPGKFLERARTRFAADALSGGAPVGKAIEASGFSDFQQMQRAFKRHLGTTVGAYRRRFEVI